MGSAKSPDSHRSSSALLGGILVGGASRRMGVCKASLVMPDGQSLYEHVGQCLVRWCDEVIVSVSDANQLPKCRWPVVVDRVAHKGPATGIASLVEYAHRHGFGGTLVLSVDLPAMAVDDLGALVETWCRQVSLYPPDQNPPGQSPPEQNPPGQNPPGQNPPGQNPAQPRLPILAAQFGDERLHPLVAIYPTAYRKSLQLLAASEDRSVRRWIANMPHQAVPMRPQAGQDVDTPEQWQIFCNKASDK